MTRTDQDPTLLAVAEAVADGLPVDWNGVRSTKPELSARLERLQLLSGVAMAHRAAIEAAMTFAEAGPSRPNATAPESPSRGRNAPPKGAAVAIRLAVIVAFALSFFLLWVWLRR